MPNICCYDMRVRGEKESVKKFYDWLDSGYNYTEENKGIQVYRLKDGVYPYEAKEEDKIPTEHHIGYRVFSAYTDINIDDYNSGDILSISGDCAWSVRSSMFSDGYMGDSGYGRPEDKAISIEDASKELGIEIEIFSEEPGMCFSEHYYLKNGEVICEETSEFNELWLEYFNKDSDSFEEESYNELPDELKALVDEALADGSEDVITECEFLDEDDCWAWEFID